MLQLERKLSLEKLDSVEHFIIAAQIFAVIWWSVSSLLADSVRLWGDQFDIFMKLNPLSPYSTGGFINPPWAAVILEPFSMFPISVSVYIQLSIYFIAIALIVRKYGGSILSVVIVLSSFVAFDNAIELNVDWISCIGIIAPVWLGAIFLPIKPQLPMSYFLTLRLNQIIIATGSIICFSIVVMAIWGFWPNDVAYAIQHNIAGQWANIAPMYHIPVIMSVFIGITGIVYGMKKGDPVIIMISWIFFVPYIKLYSLLVYMALSSAKWPVATAIVSILMWIIYSIVIITSL